MKHICITGYNSFIGKNFYKKYKNKFKILPYKKNINNLNELKKFIQNKKITHLVNFAGLSRIKCEENKINCINTNFKSIKKIINFLNKFNDKPHFIFISTSHVYNFSRTKLKEKSKTNPKNIYSKLKLRSENYIKRYYKNYTILRLFNIYGPNQSKNYFIQDMREKIRLVSSAGTGHFYTTDKNKSAMPDKMEIKKFDPVIRKHVIYTEAKIK